MDKNNMVIAKGSPDPTFNVREMFESATNNQDRLREAEIHRIDHNIETEITRVNDKFKDIDTKYQIQFTAAKEAVGIASTAQEKLVAQALDGTKEAINKADVATDKRFEMVGDKVNNVMETLNKNTGAQGIYVTHTDLAAEMEKLRTSFEGMLRPVITFMNNAQGQQKGIGVSWGVLLGAVGLIGGLLAIFLAVNK